ncbi:MAG: cation:proton antiporter [Chloroflexi bacterium]|nr:cation:proton antiporter [Chloroflexota bacterium]
MNPVGWILLDLLVMFVAAKLFAEVCERIGQPAVVGEILAGVMLGPHVLGWIGVPSAGFTLAFGGDETTSGYAFDLVTGTIAELGVVILLFHVGLQTRLSDLTRTGTRAALVAIAGVVVPFGLGFSFMATVQESALVSVFTATVLVATSVGVTARVLRDIGAIALPESRVILGAAVIDDVLGMVVLTIVGAMAGTGGGLSLSPDALIRIGVVLVQTAAFIVFVVGVGRRMIGRYSVHLEGLRTPGAPFTVAIGIALALAVLSSALGLAAVVGAFLAGMILAEARERYQLEAQVLPLSQLFVPIFFVATGAQMDPMVLSNGSTALLAGALTGLAIVGKVIGGAVGAAGMRTAVGTRRTMAIIGIGMVPRGEVGLVVAGIGHVQGILNDTTFSALIVMTLVTTLLAPPALRAILANDPRLAPDKDGVVAGPM